MAGGKGERFWPLSSEARPKQLLSLVGDKCMLQMTLDRISGFIPIENTVIVAGSNISQAIVDECSQLTEDNILSEPTGRNTCLAIGFTAVHLRKRDPDAVMVVLSADHLIQPVGSLVKVIKAGTKVAAEESRLITIGIVPNRAETGYGYIELSDDQWETGGVTICRVAAFTEKPRPSVAQQYYIGRRHLWNSGMFIWSVKAILEALEKHMPDMYESLLEYETHIGKKDEKEAREKLYHEAEPISIDYAVLEESDNVLVLKADFVWDDIGSWLSLQRFMDTDGENNVTVGDVVTLDSYENTLYNSDEGLIATLGVSDLVVARVGNAVLVAHKTKLNHLKDLLTRIAGTNDLKKYL